MKISGLVAFVLLVAWQISFAQKNDFVSTIQKERKLKDLEFINKEESPLPQDKIATFKGLRYYKPNPKYIVEAEIIRYKLPDTIKMKTTTERLPLYIVYGRVHFVLNGKHHTLNIYQNVGLMQKPGFEDYLFVPFTDETSGNTSYGGGRYIDARLTDTNMVVIDFNKAYNPYCVYNKKYSCPIPPSENHLNTKVKAGEKNYP